MKFNLLLALGSLACLSTANPLNLFPYELEGFAKDNPIGKTTGGKGGATVTVSDAAALATAVAGSEPRVVYIKGAYNLTSRLRVGSNKSLIGVKKTADITGSGITVANATNVIIQNIKIHHILDNDCITLQNSTRIWVDHNEFESDINHGPDYYVSFSALHRQRLQHRMLMASGQDGQVDIVRASDWITVSWNYFHDHWKVG